MNHFVVGILLFLGTSRASVTPLHPESPSMTLEVDQQRRETQFSWAGSCEVKCDNGECKRVCASGVVLATDANAAKIKAQADLRVEARRQGTVVEGSFAVEVKIKFSAGGEEPQRAPANQSSLPAIPELVGLTDDQVTTGLRDGGALTCGSTIERCSGQLTVEDGCGRRITIPRGQWVTIDNGGRADLVWYCGDTREITRGICTRMVKVFHSTNDRRIDICW